MVRLRQLQSSRAIRAGMLYIVVGALLWAVVESIGVYLVDDQHPLQVVWVRYATHLALLLAVFAPRRGAAVAHAAWPRLQVARGLLMLLMPLFFLAAARLTKPADVLSVFWVTPLLTMALATWLLREHVGVWRWPLVLGGWAGTLLLMHPDAGALGLGALPALGMAGCMSLYLVLTRMLRDESTITNLVFTAACVLAPLSLALPAFWTTPTGGTIVFMAAIGLFGLGGLYAFDRAVEVAPVSLVVPMLYTQPVWLALIAVLAGSLHLGRADMLGTALVVTVCTLLLVSTGWKLTSAPSGDLSLSPEQAVTQQMRTRT